MSQSLRPCILWGATGQAKVAYDILVAEGIEVIHIFDNKPDLVSPLQAIPISYGVKGLVAFVETLSLRCISPSDIDCIAAIGGSNGEARVSITKLMESYGFKSRSLIHKSVVISSFANIGKSVQLLAGSIVGAFASIGDCTIINSGANVDHDCSIGKGCHLAPCSTLAGEVTIDDYVFIGTNATILPRLCISTGAIVGAGAVVTKDVMSGAVVAGNPARPLE